MKRVHDSVTIQMIFKFFANYERRTESNTEESVDSETILFSFKAS
jgi:hypothetical protein